MTSININIEYLKRVNIHPSRTYMEKLEKFNEIVIILDNTIQHWIKCNSAKSDIRNVLTQVEYFGFYKQYLLKWGIICDINTLKGVRCKSKPTCHGYCSTHKKRIAKSFKYIKYKKIFPADIENLISDYLRL